jgi:hypothetical protein
MNRHLASHVFRGPFAIGGASQAWAEEAGQGSRNGSGPLTCLAVLPGNVSIVGTVFGGMYALGTDVRGEW